LTQAQATNAKLELLRHIEQLQCEDKWDCKAFHAALMEAIAIREAQGDTRSSLEWLYNEARSEWLEGIMTHDAAEFTVS
jgi:hypothetical protein